MKITRKRIKPEGLELAEKIIIINRVAKVVKGGRRFSFNAMSVVGDNHGHVGIGFGKANEVPDAIRKSVEDAKKNVYKINVNKNTIPHEVIGRFKSTRVVLKPAAPGTGIIAGDSVKAVVEKAGIVDIMSKTLGSRNPVNVTKATINGLLQLRSLKEVSDLREIILPKLWQS
ncbi:MAG TPA: 30S ribosomal protein S5 [Spirochaetota bacterium]|mgnify:FL=1|nr:30S ribosomal protein S5 [Spirochaetota bacterium]HOT18883.1 30S ribosomal protein S5 [Spirochaetota bacterium]HPD04831.1 30S ribosomal protein S5 [Spirochaetota bacterium]HPK44443.1 30S ribosomal protein S5 [Spirochaetota bacterium]HQG41867.1 30S ribosomal protein S5 [Spirochaetota bacterium]